MRSVAKQAPWIVFGLIVSLAIIVVASWRHETPRRALSETPNAPSTKARRVQDYGKLPLSFEANQGQTDSQVKFLSRGHGYTLFLTGEEAVLSLRSQKSVRQLTDRSQQPASRNSKLDNRNSRQASRQLSVLSGQLQRTKDDGPRTAGALFASLIQNPKSQIQNLPAPNFQPPAPSVLRLKLVGANPNAKVVGLDPLPGKSNYFIGSDPKKWRTNVSNYAKVRYADVYPGVDLVYYGNQGRLEYDFVVAPGADPRTITLAIDGTEKTEIDASGDLVLRSESGDVRFHKPVVYQPVAPPSGRHAGETPALQLVNPKSKITNPKLLDGRFVLRSSSIGNRQSSIGNSRFEVAFEIASYDPTKPLVIDPVLSYSTYLGGSGNLGERVSGIAVDASGNTYVTGYTDSANFPTTPGAFQRTIGGGFHGFVTKLNATGSALVYSTYLGGSVEDIASRIAVDADGNAYVIVSTLSSDFPTTPGAFQTTFKGGGNVGDGFVAKLNPSGSALVYSTFLAGDGRDTATGIIVDSSGCAYVSGWTESANFPTLNPFQATCNACVLGTPDAFVTKLNPDGTGVLYSTYLGGSGSDWRAGIAVDASGSIYVAGSTTSTNFPTASPFQAALAGNADAFLTKFSPDGSALVYSTYLGGVGNDYVGGFAVDASGHAYIAGDTDSSDLPTVNAFQPTKSGSNDAFVSKFTPDGSALVYSTYLGGNNDDYTRGIAVDASGNAYLTGWTQSANFPLLDSLQAALKGVNDAFVTAFEPSGSKLVFSTYLGGSNEDGGYAIAVGSPGNIYVAGNTYIAGDFPTAPGAFQPTYGGGTADAFVAKITFALGPAVSLSPISFNFADQVVGTTSAAKTVTLGNPGSAALNITDIAASGDFAQTNDCGPTLAAGANCTISVTFTPPALGTRAGNITVTSDAPSSPDVIALTGTGVPPAPIVSLSPTSLAFGNQLLGTTSSEQTVTLSNTGTEVLTITSITPSGDFAETHTCPISPATLTAGANCTITVTFTPTARGARSGAITITDDAAGSPHTVPLSGTGVIAGEAELSTTSLAFAGQLLGTTGATHTVMLSNSGDLPLGIVSIVASGDFAQANNCGTSLAGGASCTISVTFTPTATGDRRGSVTITDDTPGSQHTVTLSGTGTDFSLSSDPTSREITAGGSATYTLGVSPVSGFNQSVALSCTKPAALTLATCSVSPSAVTPDGTNAATATITVTTTARGMGAPFGGHRAPLQPPLGRHTGLPLRVLLVVLIALLAALAAQRALGERGLNLRPVRWATLGVGLMFLLLWAACGGGGGGGPPPSKPGTPAGPYTLTLTGTVGGVSRQTTVTLQVN